ncbi:MAG TPA: DUF502 domain-containing protein [Planctomycetota bacterium]|nr:DUF502 domain-containing protein [Planctomycetota bacterium]
MAVFAKFREALRRNFVTGFLVAVPFAVTIVCLAWGWQQINRPLRSIFSAVSGGNTSESPMSKLLSSPFGEAVVPLIGLFLILIFVVLLGIVMRSFVGRLVLNSIELGLNRLPLVGMLYGSIKQLGAAFISTEGKSKFQRAVAVQFPYAGVWAIGFVTGPGENIMRFVPKEKKTVRLTPMVTVFVPTSPIPSAGFMLVVPVEETMDLDMSVQDALKMVVSGGMLAPGEHAKGAGGSIVKPAVSDAWKPAPADALEALEKK